VVKDIEQAKDLCAAHHLIPIVQEYKVIVWTLIEPLGICSDDVNVFCMIDKRHVGDISCLYDIDLH
jgi:hypothetical protein